MGRRRQPARGAWGLASRRMKELHPQSPEERRKRLARLRARFGKAAIERAKREIKPLIVAKRVGDRPLRRRLHPCRQPRLSVAAGAVPLLHPRRGHRPAVRPHRGCRAGRRDNPRPPAARCPKRAGRADRRGAPGPVGRAAVVRRDRRPVDRGQLHRDHPRHFAPRLWRQIFGQLLAVPAGVDGGHPRRGRAVVRRLRLHRRAVLGAQFRGRETALLRRAGPRARHLSHRSRR